MNKCGSFYLTDRLIDGSNKSCIHLFLQSVIAIIVLPCCWSVCLISTPSPLFLCPCVCVCVGAVGVGGGGGGAGGGGGGGGGSGGGGGAGACGGVVG